MEIHLFTRNAAEAAAKYEQCGNRLSGNCRDRSAANPHLRKSQIPENQQWVQNDVGHSAQDLRDHRRFHVAVGLQHLCPGAFKKQSEAENTDDPAILHNVRDHSLGVG